jgi:cytochrome-b5 reductase
MQPSCALPPKPSEPLASDCCGQGCTPCVQDIYDQEVKSWKRTCERIKCGVLADEDTSELMSPETYSACVLDSVRKETEDGNVYRFRLPEEQCFTAEPGQHLVLKLETESESFTRQYTILLPPQYDREDKDERPRSFEVFIKLYPNGRASKHISKWSVGSSVLWRGPFGTFPYSRNAFKFVVVLAVGTGVLPGVAVIERILSDEKDETRIEALLGFKTLDDVLVRQRWKDIAGYWNASLEVFLSRVQKQPPPSRLGGKTHIGRIGPENISHRVARSKTSATLFVVCGTKKFEEYVISLLRESGVVDERIKKF